MVTQYNTPRYATVTPTAQSITAYYASRSPGSVQQIITATPITAPIIETIKPEMTKPVSVNDGQRQSVLFGLLLIGGIIFLVS